MRQRQFHAVQRSGSHQVQPLVVGLYLRTQRRRGIQHHGARGATATRSRIHQHDTRAMRSQKLTSTGRSAQRRSHIGRCCRQTLRMEQASGHDQHRSQKRPIAWGSQPQASSAQDRQPSDQARPQDAYSPATGKPRHGQQRSKGRRTVDLLVGRDDHRVRRARPRPVARAFHAVGAVAAGIAACASCAESATGQSKSPTRVRASDAEASKRSGDSQSGSGGEGAKRRRTRREVKRSQESGSGSRLTGRLTCRRPTCTAHKQDTEFSHHRDESRRAAGAGQARPQTECQRQNASWATVAPAATRLRTSTCR